MVSLLLIKKVNMKIYSFSAELTETIRNPQKSKTYPNINKRLYYL